MKPLVLGVFGFVVVEMPDGSQWELDMEDHVVGWHRSKGEDPDIASYGRKYDDMFKPIAAKDLLDILVKGQIVCDPSDNACLQPGDGEWNVAVARKGRVTLYKTAASAMSILRQLVRKEL